MSPCVHFLAVMKCPARRNWPVWMIAEELVGNGLKGSRNSGGIGHGGLTCSGFTEEAGGVGQNGGDVSCWLLGCNYRVMKRSFLR